MTLTTFVEMLIKDEERYNEVREASVAQVLRYTYKREVPRGKAWFLAKIVRDTLMPTISGRVLNG